MSQLILVIIMVWTCQDLVLKGKWPPLFRHRSISCVLGIDVTTCLRVFMSPPVFGHFVSQPRAYAESLFSYYVQFCVCQKQSFGNLSGVCCFSVDVCPCLSHMLQTLIYSGRFRSALAPQTTFYTG
jgi:hypothetical protein